jgi:hypothetical protein
LQSAEYVAGGIAGITFSAASAPDSIIGSASIVV